MVHLAKSRILSSFTIISTLLSVAFAASSAALYRIPLEKRSAPRGKSALNIESIELAAGPSPSLHNQLPDVPIYTYYDMVYYANVTIGTSAEGRPAQVFTVIVDTGSSDLWIPGAGCSGCGSIQFDKSQSTTFSTDDKPFNVQYGSGSVSGTIGTDTVTFGGLSVSNQQFGLATSVTSQPANLEGILGLAFSSISVIGGNNVIFNMTQQGLIPQAVFSLWLAQPNQESEQNLLVLGGTDPTLYTGVLTTVPLAAETYWQVEFGSVGLNSATTGGQSSVKTESKVAIIDSGTSLIAMPTKDLSALIKAINREEKVLKKDSSLGLYTLPCSATSNLPSITFKLGEEDFSLSPSYYIATLESIGVSSSANSGDDCVLAMEGFNQIGNMWILGDVFMRKYYTTFDAANKQLQFGLAVDSATQASTGNAQQDTASPEQEQENGVQGSTRGDRGFKGSKHSGHAASLEELLEFENAALAETLEIEAEEKANDGR